LETYLLIIGVEMESQMSTAAQVVIAVVPIVGIVIGGVVVFFYLLWRNKQITLLIAQGTYKAKNFDLRLFSLLTGLLLFGIGIVLSVFFFLLEGLTYTLLGGLIPLVLGLSLILFYKVYPKENNT